MIVAVVRIDSAGAGSRAGSPGTARTRGRLEGVVVGEGVSSSLTAPRDRRFGCCTPHLLRSCRSSQHGVAPIVLVKATPKPVATAR
jgi:hypothetical protein